MNRAVTSSVAVGAGERSGQARTRKGVEIPAANPPRFENFASIEARVNGAPVYCLDYLMYIYGVSPDLMPTVAMQEGDRNLRAKIKPRKSWEIKHNLLGSTTEQPRRTRYNDSHPLLPILLIDKELEPCIVGSC